MLKVWKSFKKFQEINFICHVHQRDIPAILRKFKNKNKIKKDTVFVVGYRKNWVRYAHHLLEGIVRIFGYDVIKVRCLTKGQTRGVSVGL